MAGGVKVFYDVVLQELRQSDPNAGNIPAWVPNFNNYEVGTEVTNNGGLYSATVRHVSTDDFNADVASGYWESLGAGGAPIANGTFVHYKGTGNTDLGSDEDGDFRTGVVASEYVIQARDAGVWVTLEQSPLP